MIAMLQIAVACACLSLALGFQPLGNVARITKSLQMSTPEVPAGISIYM
jgi:hypothetical protein